jgi:hypothetical protein
LHLVPERDRTQNNSISDSQNDITILFGSRVQVERSGSIRCLLEEYKHMQHFISST